LGGLAELTLGGLGALEFECRRLAVSPGCIGVQGAHCTEDAVIAHLLIGQADIGALHLGKRRAGALGRQGRLACWLLGAAGIDVIQHRSAEGVYGIACGNGFFGQFAAVVLGAHLQNGCGTLALGLGGTGLGVANIGTRLLQHLEHFEDLALGINHGTDQVALAVTQDFFVHRSDFLSS